MCYITLVFNLGWGISKTNIIWLISQTCRNILYSIYFYISGGTLVLGIVLVPTAVLLILIIIINAIQKKKSKWLPNKLRSWDFVPLPLRSLQPYDRLMTSPPCCKVCRNEDPSLDMIIIQTVKASDDAIEHTPVTLLQSKTFFPVGPLNAAGKTILEPIDMSKKTSFQNGICNPGLEVERLD